MMRTATIAATIPPMMAGEIELDFDSFSGGDPDDEFVWYDDEMMAVTWLGAPSFQRHWLTEKLPRS